MSHCLSGCTIRGQHRSECETRGADEDACRGCLPRPAEFGNLCPWCWQRLNADVVDSPALVRYLWALGHSDEQTVADVMTDPSSPSERAILHGAIDALDGLHACLASWAHLILEEHPHGSQMHGPDTHGVRFTLTTKRLDREKFPHLDDEPVVWIRRSEVAGIRDPEATSRLVRWLLPLLAWCSEQEWAAEMRREIGSVVRTTAARYPVAERTRSIPGVTCPVCERTSLELDPPTPERPSTQVNCTTRGCGVVYSEQDFKRLTAIVEQEQQERTDGEDVA